MSKKKSASLIDRIATKYNPEQYEKLHKIVSLSQYVEMAIARPQLAMLAHDRVYKMIMSHGYEIYKKDGEDRVRYNLFSDQLFGIEDSLAELVNYFKSAAERLDTRKRILLLHGPVSGAKSTVAAILKSGLEKFSRTDEGELYAVCWPSEEGYTFCDNLDEPLKFIPEEEREALYKEYGVYIEGLPCPQCRKSYKKLEEKHKGNIEKVYSEVMCKRVLIDEADRLGIGTFSPADSKSQDMSELTGSINFKTLPQVGSESDPSGWKFDGELNRSNRGIVEFIEMLKADERFLHILLTLAQERKIKTPRFPLISADEIVLGHTNESEYAKFVNDPTREALMDRMIKIDFKYNLIVDEELKIYGRLMSNEAKDQSKHRAPNSFKVAAVFGVLTRLEESAKCDLITKLNLYNGDIVDGFKEKDVKEIKKAAKREGLEGVSPRLIVNVLAESATLDSAPCVTPFVVMTRIKDTLERAKFPKIAPKKQEEYLQLLDVVRKEYEELAKKDVLKAFLASYEPAMEDLCANYIDHVEAYIEKRKLKDMVTGEEIEPDDSLMRSIEDRIDNVSDNRREQFRSSLMASIGTIYRKGEKFTYRSDERLRKAIEKKIFDDNRGNIRITTFKSSKTDEANLKKLEAIKDRMVTENGYCEHCARDVMNYVGSILAKGDVEI